MVETLALRIKQNTTIKGYTIASKGSTKAVNILQYADDGAIVLDTVDEIPKVLNEIKHFSKVAGPELNPSKTECRNRT